MIGNNTEFSEVSDIDSAVGHHSLVACPRSCNLCAGMKCHHSGKPFPGVLKLQLVRGYEMSLESTN